MQDIFAKRVETLNNMLKEQFPGAITAKVIGHHVAQISIPQDVIDQFPELTELHIKIKRIIVQAMETKKLASLRYGMLEDGPAYVFIVGDHAWD